jgi:hypothetical protein
MSEPGIQAFLSHDADDHKVGEVLKDLVSTCSFGRIRLWFSSDSKALAGVSPGGPWFDELKKNIDSSAVFFALLTPTSINNRWLHYEAGCAASQSKAIVPLIAGLPVSAVEPPMSLYNAYNIAQTDGLLRVLAWLLRLGGVDYREQMLELPVQNAVKRISQLVEEGRAVGPQLHVDNERILSHIDKRFIELWDRLGVRDGASGVDATFSIEVAVLISSQVKRRFYLDVSSSTTLQDVANEVFFKIDDLVSPYKYLEEWIIRDSVSGSYLVVREIMEKVNASWVLTPDRRYEVVLLNRPYDVTRPGVISEK